jgi:hypothetical protein
MSGTREFRLAAGLIAVLAAAAATTRGQEPSEDVGQSLVVPSLPAVAAPRHTQVIDADTAAEICPPASTVPMGSLFDSGRCDFPFIPYMLGDFNGPLANPMTDLKASEGESPMPLDRVFYRFNMYSNLDPSRYQDVSIPYKRVNLYTNVFGFEKTFGPWVSFGVRLPINGVQALSRGTYYVRLPGPGGHVVARRAPSDYNSAIFGNINGILKLKLVEDVNRGYLVSTGVSLSFPTATNQSVDPGPSTAAIFQPFLGYIFTGERFFLQGFTAVTLPLVTVQSMLFFQDLGAGMWAYRSDSPSGFLTGFAPTVEVHLNAPLQGPQRASWIFQKAGLSFNTQFNLTFGGTFEFWHRATLGLGFVVPTVGPIPFDCEFLAHFNVRF